MKSLKLVLLLIFISSCSSNKNISEPEVIKSIPLSLSFQPSAPSGQQGDINELSNQFKSIEKRSRMNFFPTENIIPNKYHQPRQETYLKQSHPVTYYWIQNILQNCSVNNPRTFKASFPYNIQRYGYDGYYYNQPRLSPLRNLNLGDSIEFDSLDTVSSDANCPVNFQDKKRLNAVINDTIAYENKYTTQVSAGNEIDLVVNNIALQNDSLIKSVKMKSNLSGLNIQQSSNSIYLKYNTEVNFNLVDGLYVIKGKVEYLSHKKFKPFQNDLVGNVDEVKFNGDLKLNSKTFALDMYLFYSNVYPKSKIFWNYDLLENITSTAQIYINGYSVDDKKTREKLVYSYLNAANNLDLATMFNF